MKLVLGISAALVGLTALGGFGLSVAHGSLQSSDDGDVFADLRAQAALEVPGARVEPIGGDRVLATATAVPAGNTPFGAVSFDASEAQPVFKTAFAAPLARPSAPNTLNPVVVETRLDADITATSAVPVSIRPKVRPASAQPEGIRTADNAPEKPRRVMPTIASPRVTFPVHQQPRVAHLDSRRHVQTVREPVRTGVPSFFIGVYR